MESATNVQSVPFRKTLRAGQKQVISELIPGRNNLNIKLPTGYGKTYSAACVYSTLKHRGRVNRLLYIVSSDTQLNQFINDAHHDFINACVDGPLQVVDVNYFGAGALRDHRNNTRQIFVITIQSLREQKGANNVGALLQNGQWMICVDEYHHYGIDRSWGRSALALNRAFLLCMSATPSRPNDDSAFGSPDMSITYRAAKNENAVKPLKGHSYNYIIKFTVDDQIEELTTKDLIRLAGGDSPEKIENFTIKRRMRWSPDYISGLVSKPIERMQKWRIKTGFKLQSLMFAMCVSHAKLICQQIQEAYPELVVDWIGTGENGRTDNREILKRYCPAKVDGVRPNPEIDVLVNVGLAGEGLDTVNTSEIVFLNNASLNNRNLQIIGRAARYLPNVTGNVNFDASSEFAEKGYIGNKIMDAMDYIAPSDDDDADDDDADDADDADGDYSQLPDEPYVRVFKMELIEIDSGEEGVQRMARILSEHQPAAFDYAGMLENPQHPDWDVMVNLVRGVRAREAAGFNDKAKVEQLRDSVTSATSSVVGLVLKKANARRVDPRLIGQIKHEINKRKERQLGGIKGVNDENLLRDHYRWVKQFERDVMAHGVPTWLHQLFA